MALMQWADLMARPRPAADARTAYGPDPNQFGDWRSPGARGRHPLVVMIHGGCWDAKIADLGIMDWAAEDLRQRGFVVFNIEYRRLGQAGGGYPGTYEDVAAAIAHALKDARRHGADGARMILLGHSAGGHLALWAASRSRIPTASPLASPAPPRPHGVVALGAITDLQVDSNTACGPRRTALMAGEPSAARPDPYADTSPYHLAPTGIPTVLVTGEDDVTVPAQGARRYVDRVRSLGDAADLATPPGGHVDEIAPGSPAWAEAVAAVVRLAR
jgi:acetyl esterase/lipase